MSSPSSPTLDEVVENIMEEVLRERIEQIKNRETVPVEEVREETSEVEVEAEEARVFLSEKGQRLSRRVSLRRGSLWRESR